MVVILEVAVVERKTMLINLQKPAAGPNPIGSDKPAKYIASRLSKCTSWTFQRYTGQNTADGEIVIPVPTIGAA